MESILNQIVIEQFIYSKKYCFKRLVILQPLIHNNIKVDLPLVYNTEGTINHRKTLQVVILVKWKSALA